MSRPKRDSELRVGGLHISTRFALIMTLALTLVMSVAALSLYSTTNKIARTQQERTAVDAVKMLAEVQELQQRTRRQARQRLLARAAITRSPEEAAADRFVSGLTHVPGVFDD